MTKIVVKNLSKIFGRRSQAAYKMMQQGNSKEEILKQTGATVAVRDVSFSVEEGEIFVVMGLSGSGKSTLLRCMNLLHQPTAGEVLVNGKSLTQLDKKELREARRALFGMVFQKFALLPHRSVVGNVEFGLEIQGVSKEQRRARAQQWIEAVGLKGWEDHYPQELSGGMQQRVGLARALALEPEVLLMDEAFSALDPLIRREMQDELLTLQAEMNKTILFITHDLDEALKLGDRIAVMRDGEIVQIGTPEEIISSPADDYVAAFTHGVDRSKILTAGSVMVPVKAVASLKDGPKTVLHRMRENGISSIFIVDRSRRLQGLIVGEDAAAAAREGNPLETYLRTDFPVVREDTPIEEVMLQGANLHVPMAVADDDRRLRGVIVKGAILDALVKGMRDAKSSLNDEIAEEREVTGT